MRLIRFFLVLVALFALGVVRTHGGDQYVPLPDFPLPDPPMPMPDDPTDPFSDPFDPINDFPLPDIPDVPPEFPLPDPIIDIPFPIPDPPGMEDPFPDIEPSLFPGELIDDFPPPIIPPAGRSAGKEPFAAATNVVVPTMPFPRRILFRPPPEFFTSSPPANHPACDPASQTRLLIPEAKRNSVYIMDTCPQLALSSRVSVGTKPVNVKVTPDGRALVANSLDGTISVINLANRTVTNTIPLPLVNNVRMQPNAMAVAPDGSRAYVSSHVDLPGSFVFILDLNTMSFTGTSLPVGGFPASMAITPDGSQLWVSSRAESRVDVFDTGTNQTIGAFGILLATGVAINPTGTRAYLAAGISPGSITVVDTSTLSTVANITVGNLPHAVAVTSTGRHIYVTNALSNSISLIDAKGNKVIRTINLKGKHPLGLALVANGSFLR